MNRIALALLASAAALAASSARADTRVSVGVNVGAPVYRQAPAVVYAPPPAVVYSPAPVVVAPTHGYWKEVVVKTWVPERRVATRNRWGRMVEICEPGYYTCRTDRVWVDGYADRGFADYDHRHGHPRHDHDRGRRYGYGQGHGNGYGWRR